MSSSYGENIRLTVFGQSHGTAIGMTLEGVPAGLPVDFERLNAFLDRRAPGRKGFSTARREADRPEFLSGILKGFTCGAPIAAVIRNEDIRPGDYAAERDIPRPGHGDYTAYVKYGSHRDVAGGGHLSGRLTAPLCIAGGICLQLLERANISVMARVVSVGVFRDDSPFLDPVDTKPFPVSDDAVGQKMQECIEGVRAAGDSVGGEIECAVTGLPAGLGDPMFDGMENRIAHIVFGIPGVKGIGFGAGFEAAAMRGSVCNDPFVWADGRVRTVTNNCGGILGGITDGMPLVFRTAFKPTPSIALPQQSVHLEEETPAVLRVQGRHDPCIVPRAVPCVEAAAAIAVYDALLGRRKEQNGTSDLPQ